MSGQGKRRAALAGRDARGRLVDPATGEAVVMSEAARVALALGMVRARAAVPDACSDAVPVAPARGPMAVHRPVEVVSTPSGPRVRREVLRAGAGAREVGALELIERASRRRDAGALFSVAQHLAAAEYEALSERVAGGRVKCLDLDGGRGGGSGSVMDAIVSDIQRLRRMVCAIGTGPALAPRGVAAAPGRRLIRVNVLVEWVLIWRQPLSGRAGLLERYGWQGQTRYRDRLHEALAAALDRLHGL